jgi:hypothetical protein
MILPQNDGVGHFSRTDVNLRPGQLKCHHATAFFFDVEVFERSLFYSDTSGERKERPSV